MLMAYPFFSQGIRDAGCWSLVDGPDHSLSECRVVRFTRDTLTRQHFLDDFKHLIRVKGFHNPTRGACGLTFLFFAVSGFRG